MSVNLHINNHHIVAKPGLSLFEHAESVGVYVPTSCVKQGKCKECMVEITEGMDLLSERTPKESHLKGNFRLSCRTTMAGAEGTVRCHTMRRGEMTIERQAFHLPLLDRKPEIDPCVTRDGERILLDGKEIERSPGPIHGLAMDLGTTTVVLRLLNLETGEIVADASFENPQRFGGSDVMSRIQYDTDHPTKVLQRTLAGYVSHAIEAFPVDPRSIYEMVIVGNSTMRDLFFRLSVYSIGQSPYRSVTELEMESGLRTTTSLMARPARLKLPIHPNARVYGVPIISGHVGADAAACMLAIDLMNEERLVALMDIGTNTELIVGNRHRIMAASCPAGPAFEGGAITCGMPALPGAVEAIQIGQRGLESYRVVGNKPAEGICGSGLIDLLSGLVDTNALNSLGRFENGEQSILLDFNSEQPLVFTERDINELAQAKGANVAGLHVVFSQYGEKFDSLERFYLAGGFGRRMNVASAKRIGLIPNLDDSKIVQIGNAAIEGACIALLSRRKRMELEELVKQVIHCRLETHAEFFHYFTEGCQFRPVESLSLNDEE